MFSKKKNPVNSYVPKKVTEIHDLHSRLNKIKYDEIIENLNYHFESCFITNFDLINNECRNDKLEYSRQHYQTIFYNELKENLNEKSREEFVSAAIKSERKDLFFEKKVINEHFRKNLEEKGIFLSSMRKKFFKKTEDCKSIKF